VPQTADEVGLLVQLAFFFSLDTKKATAPIKVRQGEVFFDFNNEFNDIGMPDLRVPLRPHTEAMMEGLVASYWAHVKGAELDPSFQQQFFRCVDTSKYSPEATVRLMNKIEGAIRLLKKAAGS
jgi:hypothetical protein